MTARDIDLLQHRIDSLTRAATRIRAHLADLHSLAYEASAQQLEGNTGKPGSRPPRAGDNRAADLWRRATDEIGKVEAVMVGLERQVVGWFMVTGSVESFRGSLIQAGEHERLLAKQRARRRDGDYTPERLIDQPPHPGRR